VADTNKAFRFVRGYLGAVLAILLILTALSGSLLSMRLKEHVKIDKHEVSLSSNMETELDVFSVQYENASGKITVSGIDGQNIVAPGTSVEYTIRIRNTDKVAIDYELVPSFIYTSDYAVPVLIRMLDTEFNYIIGDAKTWVTIEEITDIRTENTLVQGECKEYYFQWKWEYEAGNDEYDTKLGNIATKENVGIRVKFDINAAANTDIDANGGLIESGWADIIGSGTTFILLIAAIVLTVIALVKTRKPKV